MREALLVLGLVVVLAAVSACVLLPWRSLFFLGIWLVGIGFVVGVPTGIVYHVRLFYALRATHNLPRGWIWHPIQLNERLLPDHRRRVMPWCYMGAIGFSIIVIGLVLFVMGMTVALAQLK